MHPECAVGRLRVWSATDKRAKAKWKNILKSRKEAERFVVWGMTEGDEYLAYQWADKEAWINATSGYWRMKKLEWASRMASTEAHELNRLHSSERSNNGGFSPHEVPQDERLWVAECVNFLTEAYSGAMAAFVLDVIELNELATLCYRGDGLAARQGAAKALDDLREWFHERGQRKRH